MFDTKAAAIRLLAIGIRPGLAHQLVSEVQKWVRASGEEWTVDRLKELKLSMLKIFSGRRPEKIPWVRCSSDGLPKGPFGSLFRLSHSDMVKAWNAMMVSSGFVFNDPVLRVTKKQWEKALGAIRRPLPSVSSLVEGISMVHQSPFYVRVDVLSDTGASLADFQSRPTRRAPVFRRTVPEEQGVFYTTPLAASPHWTLENWDILSGTLKGLENTVLPYLEMNLEWDRKSGVDPMDGDDQPIEMGLIALIQEAGYKLRFAANPFRVFQAALQPLGRALFSALRRVPNDFTFDQSGGVRLAQRFLSEGKPAVSMDLSNATDNSPLSFQLELLSRLGVKTRWLQFFESCCKGVWLAQPTHKGTWRSLQWSVGSPLGLYPTFASFALWHHSMVQWCMAECGVSTVEGLYPYVIVGDDVVIFDRAVAWLYRQVMGRFGIPISEHKTLDSDTTAEFVGRVFTEKSVIQGFKWKGRSSDESFVDFARMIGPGSLILMRERQRKVISYIADLPEPYGLGWNPLGLPLSERLTPQIEQIWQRDERLRTFERRATRINRFVYSRGPIRPSFADYEIDATDLASDQDAAAIVSAHLPGWELWEEAIWPNLQEMLAFGDVSPESAEDLRLMLHRVSSVETRKEASTLVVLERKIRRAVARSR